jgi:leucyl/phenylalanyl-tRNA--protein transferase
MPVFRLTDDIIFPPPECAEENGLLAVGGDLSEERLLSAYSMGIFPWYQEDSPILWWSPDPRLVMRPEDLKVSRSLGQTVRRGVYRVTMDRAFGEVIRNCAGVRRERGPGTWITGDMIRAYVRLHQSGYAHSVESWHGDDLAGGLYGVSLGGAFFGESMFARKADASKVAFVALVSLLTAWKFELIDCQVTTGHLMRFGAKEVPRSKFLEMLKHALKVPAKRGSWGPPLPRRDDWVERGWGGMRPY